MSKIAVTIRNILSSQGFKKYFQNTSWLFIERVLRMGIALAVGIYVARYLSPEKFGTLNFAMGFVGLFTAFASLGLDSILVRDLVKDPDKRDTLLGTAFVLKLAGVVVIIGILAVAVLFTSNDATTNALIFIIASAELFRAFGVIDYFYQSRVMSKYVVRVQMVQMLITSSVKVALILFEAPLLYFGWVVMLETTVIAVGYLYTYSSEGQKLFKWRFDKQLALSLLSESWPLTLYSLALHVQARIDQVMIGEMMGKAEVGQYSVAMRMIEAVDFIPMVIVASFAPAITSAKNQSKELYEDRLLNLYRLMFLLFVIVSIPIFIVAEPAIVLLFGEEYRPAGILLSLFAVRLFFSNMGVGKSTFITNESLFKFSLITAVVGAITNIGVNYLLIPIMGPKGAIIATIISFTVSIFLMDLTFARTRPNLALMMKGIASFWKLSKFK